MLEQDFQLVQHRPHATRRLRDQGIDELQVLDEKFGITQPIGGDGRSGEQQLDHRPRGSRGQFEGGSSQVADNVLADLLGDHRRFLDPGFHQRITLAESANGGRTLQVVVQTTRREHLGRFVPIGLQRILAVRRQVLQQFGIISKIE
ncbi:MAG: hypothetical protein U1A22_02945 [Xanthomonadaceae bacterium]|nr:hypothetical protein [Xanthomonadaceae bacterium]